MKIEKISMITKEQRIAMRGVSCFSLRIAARIAVARRFQVFIALEVYLILNLPCVAQNGVPRSQTRLKEGTGQNELRSAAN